MADDLRGWRTAALACAGAALLLFLPLPLPPGSRVSQALGGTVHVVLFAGLAWIVGRHLPIRLRGWVLWGCLALLSAGAEWLQPRVGRTAELVDWLYGVGGAACICGIWRRSSGARWGMVLALALFPLGWEAAMWRAETRSFPALAVPGSFWAARGWTLNSVRVSSASDHHFKVESDPGGQTNLLAAYPGVFRAPARSDWRRLEALDAALFWPGPGSAVFAFRADDRPGNPAYADRFQLEFSVTPGWNAVHIPAKELGWTSGGRALRLDSIHQWGVFLVSDVPLDYFLLGAVRLTLQRENP